MAHRTKQKSAPSARQYRSRPGLSLVELLVAMAIGLTLVLLVTQLYLGSKKAFSLNDDNMRLHQEGSYAMMLMAQNLRQAGFGHLTSASFNADAGWRTDLVNADGSPAQGLRGCDNGFVKSMAPNRNFSCSSAPGMASFEVAYRVSDSLDPASGAGADCNGAGADSVALPPEHPAYAKGRTSVSIARNRFFVATRTGNLAASLYCQGNMNTGAQPVINNVEDMRLIYAVAAAGEVSPLQFLNAAQVDALSADQYENWKRVISVKLCLQIRSNQNVTAEPQQYVDCDGTAKLASDRKLRAVFTRVVTLRNNAAGSLSE
ncbi:PilW family protein [Paraherbaspirillum soli]|uniref:PilW family protein n=1 Tax=Paraherbaspirillum soli TaxID=631222 RepID=A0ABW0MG18_9BURK